MLKFPNKSLVLSVALVCPAVWLNCAAQTTATPAKPAATAKPAAKPQPAKAAQPAARTMPAPPAEALSVAQLETAQRVFTGTAQCEFGEKVHITANEHKPGHFVMQHRSDTYNLAPEATTTGAVRLEDKHKGIMWLQIPSKSMLMNSKIGQRMVDNCLMSQQNG